jgi:hypothetical protein
MKVNEKLINRYPQQPKIFASISRYTEAALVKKN